MSVGNFVYITKGMIHKGVFIRVSKGGQNAFVSPTGLTISEKESRGLTVTKASKKQVAEWIRLNRRFIGVLKNRA